MKAIHSIIVGLSVCAIGTTFAGDDKPSKYPDLDAKNGFRAIKLGTPKSQFTGIKPLDWRDLYSSADEKHFEVEAFDPKLGDFEIAMIELNFDTDLLKEIAVHAIGKQNVAGLLESLRHTYGQPERTEVGNLIWNGKKVVLVFSKDGNDNGTATFRSKEVEAKLKSDAEKKAKEGAGKASKGL